MISQLYLFFGQTCNNPYGIVIPCRDTSSNPIETAIKLAIAVAAGVSILFVTIGAFRYVISAGDPGNISKAKNTIIYALVGLVVSVTVYGLVTFVIDRAAG